MNYTQEELSTFWQRLSLGEAGTDDPCNPNGALVTVLLANEPALQRMLVQVVSPPTTYVDCDVDPKADQPHAVYKRSKQTAVGAWSQWTIENQVAGV